jgi:hypothetical protein
MGKIDPASVRRGERQLEPRRRRSGADARDRQRHRRREPRRARAESARARAALEDAFLQLGDRDSCLLELSAAGSVFERLGAVPDLERARARLAEVRAT